MGAPAAWDADLPLSRPMVAGEGRSGAGCSSAAALHAPPPVVHVAGSGARNRTSAFFQVLLVVC